MAETLIAIARLLSGRAVHATSDLRRETVDALELLTRSVDLIECKQGTQRWWCIPENIRNYIKDRAAQP